MITLIACLDMASGLSDKEGNLLFNIPKDMEHFRSITRNNHVVMGRKTWDSLPFKPLSKRKNYVVSKDASFNPKGATVLESIEEILELSKDKEVFVMGGGEIYKQVLPHADKMVLTQVHEYNFKARVFFPEFSPKEWKLDNMQRYDSDNKNPSFTFATYIRKDIK